MKRIILSLVLTAFSAACMAQVSFGDASIFNSDWKFHPGDIPDWCGAAVVYDDSDWESLELPHDWSVKGRLSPDLASCTGYLPGGIGWYRKHFSGSGLSGRGRAYIYFEGVYNRSSVFLNGHLLGERPSGYASFLYDMTPYLNLDGDNVLSVRVDHSRSADSRWYTGSGIYRNVWLVESGDIHFSRWGIGYRASDFSGSGCRVSVDVSVDGLEGASGRCMLSLAVKDASGKVVARSRVKALPTGTVEMKLRDVHRWSTEDPYLYTIEAELLSGREVLDRAVIEAGFRELEFDPDRGFALNGEWMKVKGVCLHHDAGVLGAAVPDEVWERRLRNLKEIGVNAIRTSHNPQSPVFYALCDRLGLLVMDEAFDEWEFPKRKWIEGWNVGTPSFDGTFDFFEEWGETDLRDMVLRDRNHPSVFLWSIGNEVDYPNDPYSHPVLDGGNTDFSQPAYGGYDPDAPDAMRIGEIARRLAGYVRDVDSSRPVTGALAGVAMSNNTAYPEVVDVVGYNYTESRYREDHERYPERVIYGSENGHDYAAWTAVRDNEFIFGQFLWTGTDYLGESTAWPSRGFYSGLLDFGSFLKPRGHFRASLWSGTPVCYIGTTLSRKDTIDAWDDWNYAEGDTVHVVCYTNAAHAELFLNGKPVGERREYDLSDGIISWDIPFSAGELRAVGYDSLGNPESEYSIVTSLRPCSLRASVDRTALSGRGAVAHVTVEVLDDNGNVVHLADNMITCTVEGPGVLLGLEGSDNSDMTDYTDNRQRAFRGRLLAYIRSGASGGEITVKFASPLLSGTSVTIPVN